MRSGGVDAALEMIETGYALLGQESFATQSHPELLAVQSRLETIACRHPAVSHTVINRLSAEASPVALGGKPLADVLSRRLRISTREAHRRIGEAADLGPRTALTGQQLAPTLPHIAAAQANGEIGAEHVAILRRFFDQLPGHVNYQAREQAEAHLARIACGLRPDEVRQAAQRLAHLLNQDGELPTDADRARKRHLTLGKQQADGMSELRGLVDPECRATIEAVWAKWASTGMCNADDQSLCVDGAPSEAQIHSDQRSQGQRNHDALNAMGRSVLSSGELGKHNGLPATIVVTTTLQELESGEGFAVTGAGSLLPMSDVIRLASHSHHYLYIYDKHTKEPLYLGRSKRLASAAQRIVLYAQDRGCTHPGCTVPAYGCQVHHAELDWAQGGQTDIADETLACPPHNRMVTQGGWRTRKRKDGTTEWIPPPHLDTGQTRVNNYHHPQRYLVPEEEDDDGSAP